MLPTVAVSFTLAAASLIATVHGHGQMLLPSYRPITEQFLADSGALAYAGTNELQWSPVEQLAARSQADFPEAATFNIMNGCRGLVYESANNVTTLAEGADFELEWYIQAPHPGWMVLSIVKPSTDSTGTITYEQYMNVTTIDPFAESGGTFTQTVTMPTGIEGCDAAGDCALQFYWHSDTANQTYPTCADIIISTDGTTGVTVGTSSGSTSAASTTTTTTSTATASSAASAASTASDTTASSAATTSTPTTTTSTPTTTTTTTTTTTSTSGSVDDEAETTTATTSSVDDEAETTTSTDASEDEETDEEETDTPVTTTATPTTTTATPTTTTTSCRRRMRN